MPVLPGWNSADAAEKIHSRLELLQILSLALAVICYLWAWLRHGPQPSPMATERNEDFVSRLELIADIALACLVVLECFAWPYGRRASKLQRAETARWEREAQESNARISSLQNTFNEQQSPRRLSDSQKQILMDGLSIYRGQKFRVRIGIDNTEGVQLAHEIADFLQQKCEWIPKCVGGVETEEPINMTPGVLVFGDGIVNSQGQNVELAKSIQKISDVFRDAGLTSNTAPLFALLNGGLSLTVRPGMGAYITTHGMALIPYTGVPDDCVSVLIGKKPAEPIVPWPESTEVTFSVTQNSPA